MNCNEMQKFRLKDICTLVTSGGTPLSTVAAYYEPKEIPWLKTGEVNYSRIYNTVEHISKEGLTHSSAKLIPTNSVIIAMYGQGNTAGRVAINKIPLATNQACCNLIINENRADYEYVYYLLSTLYNQFVLMKNGGAQPNLNAEKIKNMEVYLPPLELQHKVANVLARYDDLIENNQKQIKLLEEAAQRLYKEWFVDLRFPGYEQSKIVDGLPEGWNICCIGKLISYEIGGGWGEDNNTNNCTEKAYVIRGTDLYSVKQGKIEGIPCRYHSESSLNSRRIYDGDIIFEVSGGSKNTGAGRSLLIRSEILGLLKMPVMCASFCKLIRLEDNKLAQYFYDFLQFCKNSGITEKYDKRSASSIVNYRWKDFLNQEKILIPTKNILNSYSNFAEANYHKMMNCALQISSLQNARDRLLPKLMNGEIEV